LSAHRLYTNVKIRIYETIIFPVALYGFENWSPTLREAHRLRMFENRVLRKIFGPQRDEVIGGWRKLHNEELHNLYCSLSIILMIKSRRTRSAWHAARMWIKRNEYRILVGNPEENKPVGRPRLRRVDNIKMDLRGIAWSDIKWIDLAQVRDQWRALVNAVINLRVP
jgi:hypothetical protein